MVPRWFDVFIPPGRRNEGHILYAPMVTQNPDMNQGVESGLEEINGDGEMVEKRIETDGRSFAAADADAKSGAAPSATSTQRS
jgi:solute carrier family 6 GABA transporter-like protein 1